MSELLKNKLYNFEAIPPQGVWENIENVLDSDNESARSIPLQRKPNRAVLYSLAVAASILVILLLTIFKPGSDKSGGELASLDSINVQNTKLAQNTEQNPAGVTHPDAILRIPGESESTVKNEEDQPSVKTLSTQKVPNDRTPTDSSSSSAKDDLTKEKKNPNSHNQHTYVTIAGPTGQPVKISSKVAALISSDDNSPEKLAWNKKILEWKNAMNSTTLVPSTSNFMDIVELTNTLTDN